MPATPPRRRVLPVAVAVTVTAAATAAATAALTICAVRRRSPAAAAHEEPPPPPVPSWRQPGSAVWWTAGQEKPPAPVGTQRRRWPIPAILIVVALLAALAAVCAGVIQSETDSGYRYGDYRLGGGSATDERSGWNSVVERLAA